MFIIVWDRAKLRNGLSWRKIVRKQEYKWYADVVGSVMWSWEPWSLGTVGKPGAHGGPGTLSVGEAFVGHLWPLLFCSGWSLFLCLPLGWQNCLKIEKERPLSLRLGEGSHQKSAGPPSLSVAHHTLSSLYLADGEDSWQGAEYLKLATKLLPPISQ